MTPSSFQSSAGAPDGPFGPHTEAPEAIKSESDMTNPTPEIEVEKVESLIAGEPAKAIAKVERYLNARDFMGVESPFIDDQETGSSDGDPVVDLWAGDLRTLLASHATLEARATAQAEEIERLKGYLDDAEDVITRIEAIMTDLSEPDDYAPTVQQRASDLVATSRHNFELAGRAQAQITAQAETISELIGALKRMRLNTEWPSPGTLYDLRARLDFIRSVIDAALSADTGSREETA